jgi:hypothetical protein
MRGGCLCSDCRPDALIGRLLKRNRHHRQKVFGALERKRSSLSLVGKKDDTVIVSPCRFTYLEVALPGMYACIASEADADANADADSTDSTAQYCLAGNPTERGAQTVA